jgi:hypothetical protein
MMIISIVVPAVVIAAVLIGTYFKNRAARNNTTIIAVNPATANSAPMPVNFGGGGGGGGVYTVGGPPMYPIPGTATGPTAVPSFYPSSTPSYQPVPQSMSDPQSYGVQMTTLGGGGGNAGLSSYPYGGGGNYGNPNAGMNLPMNRGNYHQAPTNMDADHNYQVTNNRNQHFL